MTGGPASRRSWKPARTAGILAAVFLFALSAAVAQNRRSGGVSEYAEFESGRQQYHRICAQCHGRNMINSGTTVYDLRRFPENQPERFFQSLSKGKGNMPSFQDALSREQMDGLWAYVRNRGEAPK